MRISFSHQYDVYRNDLMKSQSAYFEAQKRVSTGKRIHAVSDDPFAATSSISLRQVKNATAQYAKNTDTAKSFLNFTENSLSEMSKLMGRVNELAVAGASGTTDQSGRDAMALELGEIQRRLVDLANSKGPAEQYLFSGQKTDTKPFVVDNGTVTYAGDANTPYVELGPNDTLSIGTPMGTFVPDMYAKLQILKQNLQSGNNGAISDVDIANVQTAKKALDQMRGDVGTRSQTATQTMAQHTRRIDELTSRISDLEDVDISQAILDYTTAETAYQAAMQTVSMGSQLSLLNFLR